MQARLELEKQEKKKKEKKKRKQEIINGTRNLLKGVYVGNISSNYQDSYK